MTRTRIASVVVLALALAVLVAGCGGDDDSDQFREDYNAAVDRLSKINTDIGSATGGGAGQSNSAIAKEFNQIADTAAKTRSELAGLDPPDDAKGEFDSLLSALDEGVDDLRAVAGAAKSNNPQEARRAVQRLAQSGQEITAAENALKKAVDG
jgi:hypothetical protein